MDRIKILLVENDDINLEVLSTYLSNDFDLDIAINYDQCINKVNSNQYDCILLDINLGLGPNGLDALKEIRKIPYYKNIPIIAVTAYAMREDKERFLAAGCDDYLAKPFIQSELLNIIKKNLKN